MARTTPSVTIVLCTCNGAAHLAAQLQSYLDQTHDNWALWVSDDGSTDATPDILRAFQATHGDRHDIRLLAGPGQGAAGNFLATLCHPDLPAGYVALSDQDDVWQPDKLARAVACIEKIRAGGAGGARGARGGAAPAGTPDTPVLYGAQSIHTDADLRPIGTSFQPTDPVGFGNALVQNMVSGHSTVLSPAALATVRQAGVPAGVAHHDWWLYLLISATGGRVVVDEAPVLFYRQHAVNTMGAHQGWRAQMARIGLILNGAYGGWIADNLAALGRAPVALTQEARAALDLFTRHPRRAGPARAALWQRMGAYRQGRLAQRVLMLAALLGRV